MIDPVLDRLCGAGRDDVPLSFLDLLERSTLDLELAAWLVARVSGGASWITGSGPGGIGKTTVMRALLSFVPDGLAFAEALPGQVAALAGAPRCVVSHELSDHPPPTYLWGQDLRDFFALAGDGGVLVGNVHADDLDEVRAQVVGANAVPRSQLDRIGLLAFLRMEGQEPGTGRVKDVASRRYLARVYWSDGAGHELVYTSAGGLADGAHRDRRREARCRAFLEAALAGPARTVQELRRSFLAWERSPA